jgi:hypothetical protein
LLKIKFSTFRELEEMTMEEIVQEVEGAVEEAEVKFNKL